MCRLLQLERATLLPPISWASPQQLMSILPTIQQYFFSSNTIPQSPNFHPIQQCPNQAQITEHPSSSTSLVVLDRVPFQRTLPPPPLSTWKFILIAMKPHKTYFLIQLLVLAISITLGVTWAVVKHDIGTASGLAGIVFALGSMVNSSYDKCSRNRRTWTPGGEGQQVPEGIQMKSLLIKPD